MAQYKVLIVDSRYPAYEQEKAVLRQIDAEIFFEHSNDQDKIAAALAGVDALIVNLAPVTAKVIAAMDRCKYVSRYGVAYDNVDTVALKRRGICLANVPDFCGEDVSDHAFALWMDCVRKISRKDKLLRQGRWNLTEIQPAFRTAGKTFGLIGYGRIAKHFHRKLAGFKLSRVLIADPFVSGETARQAGVELVDLATLCRESDYISIHAPLTDATRGLIGSEQFSLMKPTAILINTSRGPLVDEAALVQALRSGQIACAGLDVFATEPLPDESELRKLDNVTLTDHAGWYSVESMIELKTKAAQNIVDAFLKGTPTYPVKI